MREGGQIYVAGHNGMVGSAIVRSLRRAGFDELLLADRAALDLTRQEQVEAYFADKRPEYVFLAAAKVGGILANASYPADFIRINLQIQTNVIEAAFRNDVRKLLFLGSSCIYPRVAQQPITEDCLLAGPLEPTNESYAVAKIAGVKMCQAYRRQFGFDAISAMPTNLYGPGDNFDLETSHVLPALLRKFHEAKLTGAPEVLIWGSGTPRREFLHVDDLGEAALFLMKHHSGEEIVNVGCGEDIGIGELAALIGDIVGFPGSVSFDSSKPDGTPRKLLDVSRLTELGWRARIGLRKGIRDTYTWFLENGACAG